MDVFWDVYTHTMSGLIGIVVYQQFLIYRTKRKIKANQADQNFEIMREYSKADVEATRDMYTKTPFGSWSYPDEMTTPRPIPMYEGVYVFPEERSDSGADDISEPTRDD